MRLLIRLLGLVIVMAVLAVVLVLMLPGDRIARIAADQISKQTGRQVTLEGDTRITFWPILGVSAGRLTVANADWSDQGAMITADAIKIGVEPQALFGGEVRITGLEAQNPKIRLERAANGQVNWELGVQGVAPSGQSSDGTAPARSKALALTLDRALVQNGMLSFTDHGAGQSFRVAGVDIDLRWPDYAGTATFDMAFLLPGKADGERLNVTGQLDQVGKFIEGIPTTVQATLKAPGGTVGFAGRAASTGAAEGKLTANLNNTARLMAALGQPAADIPEGLGKAMTLDSLLTVTPAQAIALRDTALTLDANRFTGGADIDLSGTKPRVSAQLNAGALDFSGFAGSDGNETSGGGTSGGGTVVDAGWSKTPIDASALALMDGDFALKADSIDLGDLKLGKTRALATLTRSRLVFDLRELRSYDGLITGEFVINNRSGLSVGGSLKADNLNIQSLLRDATGITRLTGNASGALKFLGVGQSMHAIMNSLSGSGNIATGRGVIEGFDLDRLMRSGDLTGGTTVFDSLTASFTMKDGQMFNNDLLMSLPLASAEGKGRIGLGPRDIDYLFTPKLLSGENRKGLAIPVRIKGPWANPRIVPDLEKAIDLNLEKEKEELEQRVKEERKKLEEKAKEKLSKELGVQQQEGQSVEDALKDALEEEAKKGLLKLFE